MPQKDFSRHPAVELFRRVTDLWLDPTSAIRRKAIEALQVSTGYRPDLIERALTNAFGELTQEKILTFVRTEPVPPPVRAAKTVLHIAAGNVFTSWLHGAVITLLMGHRCWIKPSAHEPVFAKLWHQSIQMIDFTLAAQIAIVSWSESLLTQADAVVAYGNDETLATFRSQTPPGKPFVGFGHKISVAIALREASEPDRWPSWRDRLMKDSELFDLNGCLSPQVLYVEGDAPGAWAEAVTGLHPAPSIRAMPTLDAILSDLDRFGTSLSAIGIAGPLERLPPFEQTLKERGVSRLCALGDLQRPPLSWRNGGVSLVEALKPLSLQIPSQNP